MTMPAGTAEFIACDAPNAILSGQRGEGKTHGLMMAAAHGVAVPTYRALIVCSGSLDLLVRRITARVAAGAYGAWHPEASYSERERCWRFPLGATIRLDYAEPDDKLLRHVGAEYDFVGFDDLVGFTEQQYRFLSGRIRGATARVRATMGFPAPAWFKWTPQGPLLFHANMVEAYFATRVADEMAGMRAR